MGTARWNHAAAVLDGKLYAVGGHGGNDSRSCERYDPAADAWEPVPDLAAAGHGLELHRGGDAYTGRQLGLEDRDATAGVEPEVLRRAGLNDWPVRAACWAPARS